MGPERTKDQPHIPEGEALVGKVIEITQQALIDTYPILRKSPFIESMPSSTSVSFLPLDDMLEIEIDERNFSGNNLYGLLRRCDVPQETIDKGTLSSSKDFAYTNRDSSLYVHENFSAALNSGDPRIREQAAFMFADVLMNESLKKAPIERELSPQLWRTLAKQNLKHHVFDFLEERAENAASKTKLRVSRGMEFKAIDERSRLVTKGAIIHALLSDQDTFDSEFSFGHQFNKEIIWAITRRAMLKYRKIVNSKYRLNNSVSLPQADGLSNGEEIVKALGIPTSPRRLLEYYLDSSIPHFYIGSENPKINPWDYPI